jgi:hypothetical protein
MKNLQILCRCLMCIHHSSHTEKGNPSLILIECDLKNFPMSCSIKPREPIDKHFKFCLSCEYLIFEVPKSNVSGLLFYCQHQQKPGECNILDESGRLCTRCGGTTKRRIRNGIFCANCGNDSFD